MNLLFPSMVWNCRTDFHPSFSSQFCSWDYCGLPFLLENSSLLPFSKPNTGISKTAGWKQCSADPLHHHCPLWALTITHVMIYATNLAVSFREWDGGTFLPMHVKEWSDRSNPSHPGCPASLISGETLKESLQGNRNTLGPSELLGFFNYFHYLLTSSDPWLSSQSGTFGSI